MPVTIHAVPLAGGPQTTITIDKTGPDTGSLSTDDGTFDVYNVQASADGKKLICKTQVFFFVVTISVTVLDSRSPDKATVSLTIENAPVRNGTTDYVITASDETDLIQFVAGSHFPVLTEA
jgi:hypothetical protein